MSEDLAELPEQAKRVRARRTLTYLLLFAIVMFFAGLTSAYVVSMSGAYWVHLKLPPAFVRSTLVIAASSLTMHMALWSARRDKHTAAGIWLVVTLLFGLSFTFSQFSGWADLMSRGNFTVGHILDNRGVYGEDYSITKGGEVLVLENGNFYLPEDGQRQNPLNAELDEVKNTASSYLYVLTAGHLAHLFAGLIALVVMMVMAFRGRYTATSHIGLWAGTLYWHFLTGLWIYLFSFLTLVH